MVQVRATMNAYFNRVYACKLWTQATIGEYEIHEYPLEVKRLIGYLPERVPLYDEMTVKSFLKFVAKVKGLSSINVKLRLMRVVQTCGLKRYIPELLVFCRKVFRQRLG
jgi:ABC-2 type transport system ATP-binding protein